MKKYKAELIAGALTVAMVITWTLIGNVKYSLLDEVSVLCVVENKVRSHLGKPSDTSDAYFVNVGYDKQVIDVQVSPLDSGRVVITDRQVLLDFLRIAQRAHYKYIFLDIRFEKGYDTAADSALFAQIEGMRNIVVAHHYEPLYDLQGREFNGFEIADSLLLPKTAYNDYYTSVFSSNFTRYPYLLDGRPSVALRMYQDLDGKTLERCGWFYTTDGWPCENCPFVPIMGDVSPVTTEDATTAQYYNLGPFLMTLPEQQLIEDMEDKIVVVGDFDEDVHDTYMSMQPGPYLTYLAYKYLARGGNKISPPVLALMTLVFFVIIWSILRGRKPFPCGKHRFIRFFTALLSWSLLLTVTCIVVYLLTGYTFNVLVPSIIISLVSAMKEAEEKPTEEKSAEEKTSEMAATV